MLAILRCFWTDRAIWVKSFVTLKLLEPLETLAKRAARSAASITKSLSRPQGLGLITHEPSKLAEKDINITPIVKTVFLWSFIKIGQFLVKLWQF